MTSPCFLLISDQFDDCGQTHSLCYKLPVDSEAGIWGAFCIVFLFSNQVRSYKLWNSIYLVLTNVCHSSMNSPRDYKTSHLWPKILLSRHYTQYTLKLRRASYLCTIPGDWFTMQKIKISISRLHYSFIMVIFEHVNASSAIRHSDALITFPHLYFPMGFIRYHRFSPEASSGVRVLSLPASVCVSVCVCGNHLLVRAITQHPCKLGSLNLDHRCKKSWLRSVLFLFFLLLLFILFIFFFLGGVIEFYLHHFCVFEIFVGHAKAESDALFHIHVAPHMCSFPYVSPKGRFMDRKPV